MSALLCENLYKALDRVVAFNALSVRNLSEVSLTPSDYQLFKLHNQPRNDGTYRYRNLTIKSKFSRG